METYALTINYYYAKPGKGVEAVRRTTYCKNWHEVEGFIVDPHWQNYIIEVWEHPTTLINPLLQPKQQQQLVQGVMAFSEAA